MNLSLKRYWRLWLLFIVFSIGLFSIGEMRISSYEFGTPIYEVLKAKQQEDSTEISPPKRQGHPREQLFKTTPKQKTESE